MQHQPVYDLTDDFIALLTHVANQPQPLLAAQTPYDLIDFVEQVEKQGFRIIINESIEYNLQRAIDFVNARLPIQVRIVRIYVTQTGFFSGPV